MIDDSMKNTADIPILRVVIPDTGAVIPDPGPYIIYIHIYCLYIYCFGAWKQDDETVVKLRNFPAKRAVHRNTVNTL